jgi:hypothetical protein
MFKKELFKMTNLDELNGEEVIFACNMLAIAPLEREQHIENSKRLLGQVETTQTLANGYALQLPLDKVTLNDAAQFIALERLCCPFLSFNLAITPGENKLWLHLTGAEGVKPFLKAELGDYLPSLALPD